MLEFSTVDYLYLFFSALAIYFFTLFMLLHFKNKKKIHLFPSIKSFPFVSLIIPAYNEEKSLSGTLKSIKELNWPKSRLEVIVVDDGSTDKTGEVAKKFPWVKLITKKNGGKASALNVGISHAKGDFVACVDSDSYPEKNSLIKMMPYFEDPTVGGVTASILVKEPKTLIQRMQAIEYTLIAWNRKLLEFIEGIYVTPGPLSLYRKKILEKVGLFDEKSLTEDIEITWRLQRANYKIRACLPARVYTNVPSTVKAWWHQRLRWHLGGEQTLIKYRKAFFDKTGNRVKSFIAPFQVMSYLISILGISTFFYVVGRFLYNFFLFHSLALDSGVSLENQFRMFTPVFLPNIFLIFGGMVFFCSIIYVNLGIKTLKSGRIAGFSSIRNVLRLIAYLTLYIAIFPFVLIHSFWRFIVQKYEW